MVAHALRLVGGALVRSHAQPSSRVSGRICISVALELEKSHVGWASDQITLIGGRVGNVISGTGFLAHAEEILVSARFAWAADWPTLNMA